MAKLGSPLAASACEAAAPTVQNDLINCPAEIQFRVGTDRHALTAHHGLVEQHGSSNQGEISCEINHSQISIQQVPSYLQPTSPTPQVGLLETSTDVKGVGVERERMSSDQSQHAMTSEVVHPSYDDLAPNALVESVDWLLRKSANSPGIDGVRPRALRGIGPGSPWIKNLFRRLQRDTYSPKAVVEHRIPKPGRPGEFRKIGIPTVEDRVVARAISRLLQPFFESTFSDSSFGYRQGRRVTDCVRVLQETLTAALQTRDDTWIIKSDIASLFDNLEHTRLRRLLSETIADRKITSVIKRFIRAGRKVDGRIQKTRSGVPQGLPLSPLLANIYLDALDQWYQNRKYCVPGTSTSHGDVTQRLHFYRYVDDLLIVAKGTEDQAKAELERLGDFLNTELCLSLAGKKTWIKKLGQPFDFLGFTLAPSEGEVTLEIPTRAITNIMAKVEDLFRKTSDPPVPEFEVRKKLYEIVRSWENHYLPAANLHKTGADLSVSIGRLFSQYRGPYMFPPFIGILTLTSASTSRRQGGSRQDRAQPVPAFRPILPPDIAMPTSGRREPAGPGPAGSFASFSNAETVPAGFLEELQSEIRV